MPPTAPDTVRVQIRGSILDVANGDELDEFSFGLGFFIEHGVDQANEITSWPDLLAELAADTADTFSDHFTSGTSAGGVPIEGMFPDRVRFNEVRAYHLGPDGSTLHLAQAPFENLTGSSSTPMLPPQCSVCVGLYSYPAGTFNTHGRRGRGRLYLPPMVVGTVDNNGRLSVANRDRLANAMGAWLNDMENKIIENGVIGNGEAHLVIIGSDEVNQQVLRIRVGRAIDTQRRRRSRLAEDYADRTISLD